MMLPRTLGKDGLLAQRLSQGLRLVEFDDLAIDWSDLRRVLREATVLLQRFEMIERSRCRRAAGHRQRRRSARPVASAAGTTTSCPFGRRRAAGLTPDSLRPACSGCGRFWRRPRRRCCCGTMHGLAASVVPVCGGEPDFSVWAAMADGSSAPLLGQWSVSHGRCPFCEDHERGAPIVLERHACLSRRYV